MLGIGGASVVHIVIISDATHKLPAPRWVRTAPDMKPTNFSSAEPPANSTPLPVVALIALAWTLPFLQTHHRFPLTSFVSEWIALVAGLALLIVVLWYSRNLSLPMPRVAIVPFALAVLLLAHALVGVSGYWQPAAIASMYLLWAGCLMVVGRWIADFNRIWTSIALAWCLVAGGLLAAVVGILQMYEIHTVLDEWVARRSGRISGNLGSPNHFALYIGLAAASVVLLHVVKHIGSALAVLLLCMLMFVLAASGSRSGWLYLASFLLIAHFWQLRSGDGRAIVAVRLGWIATTLYVVCGLFLAAGAAGELGGEGAAERLVSPSPIAYMRLGLWYYAAQMFADHPFFGVGWGNFAWGLFQRNDGRHWVDWYFDANAHNVVAHFCAETGIAGLLLLVPLAILARRLLLEPIDCSRFWGMTLLAMLGVHAMLEYTLWYAYFLGMAALLVGWLDAGGRTIEIAGRLRVAIATLAVAGVWACVDGARDHHVLEQALDPVSLELPGVAPKLVSEMVRMQRGSLLLPELEVILSLGLLAESDGATGILEMSERVVRHAPSPAHVFRHAVLLQLTGREEEALRLFDRGLMLFDHLAGARTLAASTLAAGERRRAGSMAPLVARLAALPPLAAGAR